MPDADKGKKSAHGTISSADRAAMRKRSSSIGERLRNARSAGAAEETAATSTDGSDTSGQSNSMGRALKLSTELIGGVVVGSAIGWGLDYWLGTWPGFFILFFLLGFAAGMMNVVRSASKIRTGPSDPSKGPSVPDDDDR